MRLFLLAAFLLTGIQYVRAQSSEPSAGELKMKEHEFLQSSPDILLTWLNHEKTGYVSTGEIALRIMFTHLETKALTQLGQYARANALLDSLEDMHADDMTGALHGEHLLIRAMNCKLMEDNTRAHECYLEARPLFESSQDAELLLSYYLDLAKFYQKMEKRDSISRLVPKMDSLAGSSVITPFTKARYYLITAEYYFVIHNQGDTAKRLLKNGIQIAEQNKLLDLAGDCYNLHGFIGCNLMDKNAELSFQKADSLYKVSGNRRSRAHALINYARFLFTQKRYADAKVVLDSCRGIIKDHKWYYQQSALYECLAYYFEAMDATDSCFWAMGLYKDWGMLYVESFLKERNSVAESKYNGEKKQRLIETQQSELQRTIRDADEEKKRRLFIMWIAVILVISLTVIVILYRKLVARSRILEGQSQEILAMNRKLQGSLEQKELLLSEVHHRVKNNLQVISSLLEMQAESSPDMNAQRHLLEGKNRISSISLVHELIYTQENFVHLHMKSYIENLAGEIRNNLWKELEGDVVTECDDLQLPINEAIPLGMLLNELITNSYKHAKTGNDRLRITVGISSKLDAVHFRYKDNGMPSSTVNAKMTSGIGMRIIQSMVRQLHGKSSISYDKCFEFELTFKTQ